MNRDDIIKAALRRLPVPFGHLTPRKRKKRLKLLMKHAQRNLNREIQKQWTEGTTNTILWGNSKHSGLIGTPTIYPSIVNLGPTS